VPSDDTGPGAPPSAAAGTNPPRAAKSPRRGGRFAGVPRVRFLPSGRTFCVLPRATLLRAVLRARLPLARSCRGVAVCGACRVRIVDGAEGLLPMGPDEAALAAREPLRADERYACQARVLGDVTITTPYW
jgi:ferredoxin, 2Fe-2S